jgi:hypothetical protein
MFVGEGWRMKRVFTSALLAAAVIGPSAWVLSADALGPAVGERLVLAAPAADQLLHPAMDVVGTGQYPLPLLPADGATLLHQGRFEPAAESTTLLPAIILESDVARGDGCQPHLLRVAEVETDAGRFALVLAPDGSPTAFGASERLLVPAVTTHSADGRTDSATCASPSSI